MERRTGLRLKYGFAMHGGTADRKPASLLEFPCCIFTRKTGCPMLHLVCKPLSFANNLSDLDFFWDETTGEVSGKSADTVRTWAKLGRTFIAAHPIPSSHQLSPEPLKSRTDMAALIGFWYELPQELAAYYPAMEDDDTEEYDAERIY